jgi:predicted DNA binding protein
MLDVIIRVEPERSWLTDIISKHDMTVLIHDCSPFGDDGAQGLIEFDARSNDANEIVQELSSHPDVVGLHLTHSEDSKIIVSVLTKKWVTCTTILRSDCYLRDAKAFPEGVVEWHLLTPEARTLKRIMRSLGETGCQVELMKKRHIESIDRLTDKQIHVVKNALELGYFDHPRRITVRGLAKKTGIAPSTLSERLKRAAKKMAEFYLRKGQV